MSTLSVCKNRPRADNKDGRSAQDLFEKFYRRYRSRAFFSACALVGNRQDAMDLVHDAFLAAYRAWDWFDQTREFYPWFHRILRNLCLNRLRSVKRSPVGKSTQGREEQSDATVSEDPTPFLAADTEERGRRTWEAIMSLATEDREIILLREFHGLSYKSIAESMGCPVGTVMSRLHAARKRLRTALEQRGIYL